MNKIFLIEKRKHHEYREAKITTRRTYLISGPCEPNIPRSTPFEFTFTQKNICRIVVQINLYPISSLAIVRLLGVDSERRIT
jgi:hypothetical protein